jgi:hypothetical protein
VMHRDTSPRTGAAASSRARWWWPTSARWPARSEAPPRGAT